MTAWLALDRPQGPELTAGLIGGLVALAAGVVLGLVWLRLRRRVFPGAGLLLAGAAVAGLHSATDLPRGLVVGLALLAGGVLLVSAVRGPDVLAIVVSAPGAWYLATRGDLVPLDWFRATVAVTAVIGGVLAGRFDREWSPAGFPPVVLALSACGLYLAVPDTEQASVLLGAAVPLALLGWPKPLAGLGRPGAFASAGLIAWAAAAGSVGRPSTVIGGVACLGLLVAEPVARLVPRGPRNLFHRLAGRWWSPFVVGAAQLVLVLVASRVVARQATVTRAAIAAGLELLIAAAALVLVGRLLRDRTVDGTSGERHGDEDNEVSGDQALRGRG